MEYVGEDPIGHRDSGETEDRGLWGYEESDEADDGRCTARRLQGRLNFRGIGGLAGELGGEDVAGELGIELSRKKASSEPFAEVFSAIGATFDLRVGAPKVRPNKPVVNKLREMVTACGDELIMRWELDKVKRLAELLSYLATFPDSRKIRKAWWKMMGQLATPPRLPSGIWFMRRGVRKGCFTCLELATREKGVVWMLRQRCARGEEILLGGCADGSRLRSDEMGIPGRTRVCGKSLAGVGQEGAEG